MRQAGIPTSPLLGAFGVQPPAPTLRFFTLLSVVLTRTSGPTAKGSSAVMPHQLLRFLVERGVFTLIPLSRAAPCRPTGAVPRATHQCQWAHSIIRGPASEEGGPQMAHSLSSKHPSSATASNDTPTAYRSRHVKTSRRRCFAYTKGKPCSRPSLRWTDVFA